MVDLPLLNYMLFFCQTLSLTNKRKKETSSILELQHFHCKVSQTLFVHYRRINYHMETKKSLQEGFNIFSTEENKVEATLRQFLLTSIFSTVLSDTKFYLVKPFLIQYEFCTFPITVRRNWTSCRWCSQISDL